MKVTNVTKVTMLGGLTIIQILNWATHLFYSNKILNLPKNESLRTLVGTGNRTPDFLLLT